MPSVAPVPARDQRESGSIAADEPLGARGRRRHEGGARSGA
jgi:hypothetical protein